MAVKEFPKIKQVKTYLTAPGVGADYHDVEKGHWLVDNPFATPMAKYPEYKHSRASWGLNALGSFYIEIIAEDGTKGIATGFGGKVSCILIRDHFNRFLIGEDPRNLNVIYDKLTRSSMYYGRKGVTIATISAIDLALWDLLGKIRNEPVYQMIGGAIKSQIDFYCTGIRPDAAKLLGFNAAKVPLPYSPDEGHQGFLKNVEFLRKHRQLVGDDFPLRVDCWMALTVPYTIQLVKATEDLHIDWFEEVLHPDDIDGYAQLKQAVGHITKFTTGEHEYTKYGFRKLIEGRHVDILQPDVMWCGGLTETLRIAAQAAAYDIPVVPHASGPYSYHFVASQLNTPFQEYLANSPDSTSVLPVFGDLFVDEPVPENGVLKVSALDKPGFGLTLNENVKLIDTDGLFEI